MDRLVSSSATLGSGLKHRTQYSLQVQLSAALQQKLAAATGDLRLYLQKPQPISPAITLASFNAYEQMEETICRYLQRLFSREQSFVLQINNYSGQPPGTLFLRIQNQRMLKSLAAKLKVIDNYLESCGSPPITLLTSAQLVVATQLPNHLFTTIMMQYAHHTFYDELEVNELVLIRDTPGEQAKKINLFKLPPCLSLHGD